MTTKPIQGHLWAKRSLLFAFVLLIIVGSAAGVVGQEWKPEKEQTTKEMLKPRPGDISVETALVKVKEFFGKLGVAMPREVAQVKRYTFEDTIEGLYSIDFRSALFSVDIRTGEIVDYTNTKDEKAKYPTRLVFQAGLSERIFMRNLANRFGVPESFEIVETRGYPNNVDTVERRSCTFQYKPHGFRSLWFLRSFTFVVNPSNGVLEYYNYSKGRKYEIESHKKTLTLERAKELSLPTVKKFKIGIDDNGITFPPVTEAPFLAYVLPNSSFGGLDYPKKEPYRLRLAWVLTYPGDDQLWIDADDGKVLGGVNRNHFDRSKFTPPKVKVD